MKQFGLREIRAAVDETRALEEVADCFRAYHQGKVQSMQVGHLAFSDPPGDCHVKGAYISGSPTFAVKLATGFYRNADQGIPPSDGFIAVMSASTGVLHALLYDEGWLTNLRTAMAGAVAARAIARRGTRTLGVVGSGVQARMQGEWIARVLGVERTLVWARNPHKAEILANQLGGTRVEIPAMCRQADLIVTTTAATTPLLTQALVRPGSRIVAIGADAPGKQELETALTASATLIVDSIEQCTHHGEAGWAIRAGLREVSELTQLGAILERPAEFSPDETVIADLTGLGAQDAAIAGHVWSRLSRTATR